MRRINFIAVAVVAFACALVAAPAASGAGRLYTSGPNSDRIAGFNVSGAGALTAIPTSPFAAGSVPGALTMLPDASRLFATNVTTNSVQTFMPFSNGVLQPPVSTPAGAAPAGIAVNPAGNRLFVTNEVDGTVSIYEVTAEGALVELSASPQPTVASPGAVAVSPSGTRLYVAESDGDGADDTIGAYDIGADGTLTPVAGSPFLAGNEPAALSFRPNGANLYALNAESGDISSYSVGAEGALTELGSSPTAVAPDSFAMTLTAGGTRIYTASASGNSIQGFTIGADGALAAIPGSVSSPGIPVALAATSDGASVYAAPVTQSVLRAYDAAGNGALSAGTPPTVATGLSGAALGGTVMAPNQGPFAGFSVSTTPRSRKVTFDAGNSSDPDGTIGRYVWDFGDGTTETATSANTKHTYAQNGTYEVSLAVADNRGCSSITIFTGQIVDCAGTGAEAAVTRTVKVKSKSFKTKLKVPRKQPQGGKRVKVKLKAGGTSGVSFVASGKVKAGKESYKLEAVEKGSQSGKLKKAKLKARKADSRKILRHLRKGKSAKAKIKVRFVNGAGARSTKKATAKLVAR